MTVRPLAIISALMISTAGLSLASPIITPDFTLPVNTGGAFAYTDVTIGSYSALYPGSDIRDMFGGNFSTLGGPGVVIFDNAPLIEYSVSFTTNAPLLLSGYSVSLMEDGGGQGYRSTSEFRLYADDVLMSQVQLLALGESYTNVYGSNLITLSDSFAPVLATSFRVTFAVANISTESPRVFGLSGVGPPTEVEALESVPEPGLGALAGLVCVGLMLLTKKAKPADLTVKSRIDSFMG